MKSYSFENYSGDDNTPDVIPVPCVLNFASVFQVSPDLLPYIHPLPSAPAPVVTFEELGMEAPPPDEISPLSFIDDPYSPFKPEEEPWEIAQLEVEGMVTSALEIASSLPDPSAPFQQMYDPDDTSSPFVVFGSK